MVKGVDENNEVNRLTDKIIRGGYSKDTFGRKP